MTRTAHACASGMADHTPQFAEVDRHHIHPLYLSGLLDVPDRPERAYLCSGCHDLVHHVIHHLVNEGSWGGHRLAPGLRALAQSAWAWWTTEMATAMDQ